MDNIRPEDWERSAVVRDGVNTSRALAIRYTGSQAAAHVSLAATTCDMTFEQGASTAAAAVGTGDNPGSSGVIDISALSTIKDVVDAINAAADWEAWLVDIPGDRDCELSAGNGSFVTSLTDQDCTVAAGYMVLLDTSLETAEDFYAGVTYNGPSNTLHPHDHQALHEILQIKATATYGAGVETITVYACDDESNTKVAIYGPVIHSATTATDSIPGTVISEPICGAKGKRISVLLANDTGAHTVTKLEITRRSYKFGPSSRPSKSMAYLST